MANLTLVPSVDGPYEPGDIVEFQLTTSADFPEFFGYQLSVSYDADKVTLLNIDIDDGADEPFDADFTDSPEIPADPNGDTTVGPFGSGVANGNLGGDLVVATLQFQVDEAGEIDISFSDPEGLWFLGDGPVVVYDTPLTSTIIVNTPPDAVDDIVAVDEDSSVEFDVLANDTDADAGQTLEVVDIVQSDDGTVTETAGGLTFTPDAGFSGQTTFSYTIRDTLGGEDTATVTVNVAPVNDAPTANDDTASVAEGGSTTINVLGNDTDPENDTLTITGVTSGTKGAATITADGQILYEASGDLNGPDSFTYTISDGNGGSDTATVSITIDPVNDGPTASADSATVDEDGQVSIDVLANDADPEGQALSIASFSGAANGTVANVNGELVYTPNDDFNGTDSFTYIATDGAVESAPATVSVTVNPVNDAPVVLDDTATVAEDGEVTIDVLANDTDPDGDTLVIADFGNPDNGSLSLVAGKLVYTPDAGFSGEETFDYTVDDGAEQVTGSVTVTVTPVQDPPVAVNDSAVTDEDQSVLIDVLNNDTDADGDTLTIVGTTDGSLGSVAITGGQVTYTPNANVFGTDNFTYTITDGFTQTQASVSVTITAVNDAPVAVDDTATTDEDVAVDIAVLSNDTDVDTGALSLISASAGAGGTVEVIGDEVRFTPSDGFSGVGSFTYVVSDGALTDTASVAEDGQVVIDVLDNDSDPDGDTLSFEITTGPSNGDAQIQNGNVLYIPDANYFGSDQLVYTASDGNGGLVMGTVDITVTSVNDAAVITSPSTFEVTEGQTGTLFTPTATDIDGDAITFGLTGSDAGLLDVDSNGNVVFLTAPDVATDGATLDVSLTASDGTDTTVQSLDITVLEDTDGDGVADRDDNAPTVPNADQRDSDGDGIGNIADADLNNDGTVGLEDLGFFRLAYGSAEEITDTNAGLDADFNGDGIVGLLDLGIFRSLYGHDAGDVPADTDAFDFV